jgi:hypothetical protein
MVWCGVVFCRSPAYGDHEGGRLAPENAGASRTRDYSETLRDVFQRSYVPLPTYHSFPKPSVFTYVLTAPKLIAYSHNSSKHGAGSSARVGKVRDNLRLD